MSQEEKPLSPLEAKISQAYRVNEAVEDEQREIEVRLNKIEGLKPLLPNHIIFSCPNTSLKNMV